MYTCVQKKKGGVGVKKTVAIYTVENYKSFLTDEVFAAIKNK